MVKRALPLLYAWMMAMGCGPGQQPLTAEDRCVILCEGNRGGHPCAGMEAADDCVTECTSHIETLKDECLTCVLTASGWIGESCECEEVDAFGNLDVTCDACSYTTHQRNCTASTACTRDLEECTGYELVSPSGTTCSTVCNG